MINKPHRSLARWQVAAIVIVTFFAIDQFTNDISWNIVKALVGDEVGLKRTFAVGVFHYFVPMILTPTVIAALIVGRANVMQIMGFDKTPWRGFVFAFLCSLPLPLVYAFSTPLSDPDTLINRVLSYAIFPGISEEVLFRCFLFGLLFRLAKWGFLPAAILGALIFGAGHLYQGNSFLDSAGVFGITLVAALWWSWLYVEWDYNAWVPIGFHILMNGWFNLFIVSETALLPIAGEIARTLVVVISIVVTIVLNQQNCGRKIVGRLWIKGPR